MRVWKENDGFGSAYQNQFGMTDSVNDAIGNMDPKRLEGPLAQDFNQVFLSHDFHPS